MDENNFEKILKNKNGLKCIVLCAGKGSRIKPCSNDVQKVMIELDNKPEISYVVDYWKQFTNDFIFIVGYKKEQVIDYVKKLPINSIFIEQKNLGGIADAINHVKEYVSDNFIVVLGDCICEGEFNFPENLELGIGVWKTDNLSAIKRNYSIEIKDDVINKVIEKPKEVKNNLCGMGYYFFTPKIFEYIKMTPPSKLRNEIEITDVIQNMIEDGVNVKPVFFEGNYLNVTYPEDIKKNWVINNKKE